jgi:hypothetical protein
MSPDDIAIIRQVNARGKHHPEALAERLDIVIMLLLKILRIQKSGE